MDVTILGISGSPRHGNTEILVKEALAGAESHEAQTSFINLAGKRIMPCVACDTCISSDYSGCIFDDDMSEIYPKFDGVDGLIFGAPIYYGSITAQAKVMMGRLSGLGRRTREGLRLKVGGAIGIAGARHGGQELALWNIISFFNVMGIIPVGLTSPHTQLGATGIALNPGGIRDDRWIHWRTKKEISSHDMARMLGVKVALMAKIMKAGIEATNIKIPRPY
jgi:multimeric flavodoxin WrbA